MEDPLGTGDAMATKRKTPAARPAKRTSSRTRPASASSRTLQSQQRSGTQGIQPIHPCLWFDSQAEEAAKFYVSVFKNAKILQVSRYPAVGQEIHGREPGSVMTVEFVLNGTTFTALNGGPIFKFSQAISLQVMCLPPAVNDDIHVKPRRGRHPHHPH